MKKNLLLICLLNVTLSSLSQKDTFLYKGSTFHLLHDAKYNPLTDSIAYNKTNDTALIYHFIGNTTTTAFYNISFTGNYSKTKNSKTTSRYHKSYDYYRDVVDDEDLSEGNDGVGTGMRIFYYKWSYHNGLNIAFGENYVTSKHIPSKKEIFALISKVIKSKRISLDIQEQDEP